MARRSSKKTNTTNTQRIARALDRATGCGRSEAVRRVREATRHAPLPSDINEAVQLLTTARPTPAGDGAAARPEERQLNVVPFVFSCTVPAGADRRELAQALADQFHSLRREATGEQYEGRADVIVPAGPWAPKPGLPGYDGANLLVHAWAERPWNRPDEPDAVVSDFHAAAKKWTLDRYPVPAEEWPAAKPIGWMRAKALATGAEFTTHTAGKHGAMPPGWGELIAARRAEMTIADTAEPPVGEPEPAKLPDTVLMGPHKRGGAEKTTFIPSRPSASGPTMVPKGTDGVIITGTRVRGKTTTTPQLALLPQFLEPFGLRAIPDADGEAVVERSVGGYNSDGTEGAIVMGEMGRGKTNATDLHRAQLDAAGLAYRETTKTDEHGTQHTEFEVERPAGHDGLEDLNQPTPEEILNQLTPQQVLELRAAADNDPQLIESTLTHCGEDIARRLYTNQRVDHTLRPHHPALPYQGTTVERPEDDSTPHTDMQSTDRTLVIDYDPQPQLTSWDHPRTSPIEALPHPNQPVPLLTETERNQILRRQGITSPNQH
ncbi:hypothetical protein WKI65_44065 [Streptomyces sp. MS1.AVA.3]|uniref:hypothetical protein n=1 Tax=Streptomyces decoyicus TaxID=249567 RepID=UPI0030C091F6